MCNMSNIYIYMYHMYMYIYYQIFLYLYLIMIITYIHTYIYKLISRHSLINKNNHNQNQFTSFFVYIICIYTIYYNIIDMIIYLNNHIIT